MLEDNPTQWTCPKCHTEYESTSFEGKFLPAQIERDESGVCVSCAKLQKWLEDQKAEAQAIEVERIKRQLEITYGPKTEFTFRKYLGYELPDVNRVSANTLLEWVQATEHNMPQSGLYLVGPRGVGKTHLAYATSMNLLHWMRTVCIITEPDLMQDLFAGMKGLDERARNAYNLLEAAKRADLFIWDDAGAKAQNEVTDWYRMGIWFPVINERSVNGRPVMVCSNLSPLELEQIVGPRVADRLHQTTDCERFLAFDGKSQRKPQARWWKRN